MNQLATSEVHPGKGEVKRGPMTAFSHGFKEVPFCSFRILLGGELSLGPKLSAEPEVAAEGTCQLFVFN